MLGSDILEGRAKLLLQPKGTMDQIAARAVLEMDGLRVAGVPLGQGQMDCCHSEPPRRDHQCEEMVVRRARFD